MRARTWSGCGRRASLSRKWTTPVTGDRCRSRLDGGCLVVDALFGTGLTRPLAGLLATVARDVNAAAGPVVAIDLPTGLLSDMSRRGDPCSPGRADGHVRSTEAGAGPAPGARRPSDRGGHRGPRRRRRESGRPSHRIARGRDDSFARAGPSRGIAQGRFRTRRDRGRVARQDRCGAAGRPRGAAGGRGPGDVGHPRILYRDSGPRAGIHDPGSAGREGCRYRGRSRRTACGAMGRGGGRARDWAPAPVAGRSCGRCWIARIAASSCSTRTR